MTELKHVRVWGAIIKKHFVIDKLVRNKLISYLCTPKQISIVEITG